MSSSNLDPQQNPASPISEARPLHPTPPAKASKSGWWTGALAMLAVAFGKLKFLLVFLKLAWLSKYLLTVGSMLVMIFAYAMVEPWPFAVGFVLLIMVHELGHLIVLKRYGLKASLPIFIPYVGAMIAMKEMPPDAKMEAWMAFGGPFLGGIGALLCFIAWNYTGYPLLLHLAYVGFFLNLFNLTPISPLDGGRILNAVSKWFMLLGLLVLLGYMLMGHVHPVMIIILVAGVSSIIRRFKEKESDSAYYNIDLGTKALLGTGYFALAATLAYLSFYTYQLLQRGY